MFFFKHLIWFDSLPEGESIQIRLTFLITLTQKFSDASVTAVFSPAEEPQRTGEHTRVQSDPEFILIKFYKESQ